MVDVQQLRQQVQQRKEDISTAKQKAQEESKRLSEQEKKLPRASQARLRGERLYSGIRGRKRRRQVEDVKKDIKAKKELLKDFQKGLTTYEKEELSPFEESLNVYEKQKAEADAYNYAIRAYLDLTSAGNLSNVPKSIREKAYSDAQKIKESYATSYNIGLQSYEQQLPKTPELLDVKVQPSNILIKEKTRSKNLPKIGQPILKFSERAEQTGGFVSVKDPFVYPETPKDTNINVPEIKPFNIPSLDINLSSFTKNLGRTQQVKEVGNLKDLDTSIKSLKVGRDSKGQWFLTTGSPKRFTPLISIKPVRPPTPHSPPQRMNYLGIKPIKDGTKIKKKKDKVDMFFGTNKKKSKGKNKKSFWGW